MSKRIIGFTGSFGSGCTTSAKHLRDNKDYEYLSISSDILSNMAIQHNKPFTSRKEKQLFGNYVRKNLKEDYKKIFLDLLSKKGNKIVVECFRNPIEIDFLRDEYPHFYLISLYSPKSLRNDRVNESDFEDLDKKDEGEDDNRFGQHVRRCVNNADIVIDNSKQWTTIEDAENFLKHLDSYIDLLQEPYRPPTDKEMIMHLAYSVSLRSDCIQRQVGAVITDKNYKVLSTGYNNVPHESDSCFDLFKQCYRKINKEKVLNKSIDKINFCINCGEQLQGQEKLFKFNGDENLLKCEKCDTILDNLLLPGKDLDYCRALHAEENAILSNPYLSDHAFNGDKGMTMFTTTFPCMLCAKKIANSGISHLIFVEPYPISESHDILEQNNVTIEAFEGIKSLKFNWIFRKRSKHLKNTAYLQRQKLSKLIKGGKHETLS